MTPSEKAKAAAIAEASGAPEHFLRFIAIHHPGLFDYMHEPAAKTAVESNLLRALERFGESGITSRELKQRVRGIRHKSDRDIEELVRMVAADGLLRIKSTQKRTKRFFYVPA